MKKTAYGSEIFSKFANVIMALSASVRVPPVFGGLERNLGTRLCTDTTAENVRGILEISRLIVTVAHAPTLLYEGRKRLTARTMQSVEIDVVV